jgi:hypothetical protein
LWKTISGSKKIDAVPVDSGGLIGTDLDSARRKNDLFLFFNFEAIGEDRFPDGTLRTSFKPTGEAFRALVTLHALTDREGIIRELRLVVSRLFIANPAKCVFAADLVSSFLHRAATAATDEPIGQLASEITARAAIQSSVPMITARPQPAVQGPPSAAYRAYAGATEPEILTYKASRLQLELRSVTNPADELHLIVAPKK